MIFPEGDQGVVLSNGKPEEEGQHSHAVERRGNNGDHSGSTNLELLVCEELHELVGEDIERRGCESESNEHRQAHENAGIGHQVLAHDDDEEGSCGNKDENIVGNSVGPDLGFSGGCCSRGVLLAEGR